MEGSMRRRAPLPREVRARRKNEGLLRIAWKREAGQISHRQPAVAYHTGVGSGERVGGGEADEDAAGAVLRMYLYAGHYAPIHAPHERRIRTPRRTSGENSAVRDGETANGSHAAGGSRAACH